MKYKKKSKYKDSRKQIGYGLEQVVLRRNKIGKEISLVVLVIPNNYGNAYLNKIEISSHPLQNATNAGKDVGKV